MAKKVQAYIKLQVAAGQANPSPPVGPALGQHGVNIMEFCKAFNAQTQQLDGGAPVPVVITVYNDRSFTFTMKTPPASYLLKKAAGIKSGSGEPNTKKVGRTRDSAHSGIQIRSGQIRLFSLGDLFQLRTGYHDGRICRCQSLASASDLESR